MLRLNVHHETATAAQRFDDEDHPTVLAIFWENGVCDQKTAEALVEMHRSTGSPNDLEMSSVDGSLRLTAARYRHAHFAAPQGTVWTYYVGQAPPDVTAELAETTTENDCVEASA